MIDGIEGFIAAKLGWILYNYPRRGVEIDVGWPLWLTMGHE